MKAASVVVREGEMKEIDSPKKFLYKINSWFDVCAENGVNIVVLPALLGCLWDFDGKYEKYIDGMRVLSSKYSGIYVCPGSFWERVGDRIYHSSCILFNGDIKLFQRQIYLARWEREYNLSRGNALNITEIDGFKVGIVLSTDVFYPQVSRHLALSGVEIVLSPVAIKGSKNFAMQVSGLWQNVQQNLFFAVESGFKGEYMGHNFYSESAIHAPLEMTKNKDGFLVRENDSSVIVSELDNSVRKKAILKFDVLSQLNTEFYRGIFR